MTRPRAGTGVVCALSLAFVLVLTGLPGNLRAVPPPQLSPQAARGFLPSLQVSPTSAGSTVAYEFDLSNPLNAAVTNVSFTVGFYAFNPYPGTGRSTLPDPTPALSSGSASGASLTLAVGTLAAHVSGWTTPVAISVPSGAPAGAYSIRDALRFSLNGSLYVLESIGNFDPAIWRSATVLPNGTPTLNLTRLGVSGVLPETALVVTNVAALDWALYGTFGAGAVLLAAAAYVALRRRGPSSKAGAQSAPEESHAPSTLGNSRSRDGD